MHAFEVLGTRFHSCTNDSAVARMERWVDGRRSSRYVCVSNVYDVRLAQRTAKIRQALADAHLVVPDGMPIVWAGRLLGHDVPARVDGSTLMWKARGVSINRGRGHWTGSLDDSRRLFRICASSGPCHIPFGSLHLKKKLPPSKRSTRPRPTIYGWGSALNASFCGCTDIISAYTSRSSWGWGQRLRSTLDSLLGRLNGCKRMGSSGSSG